MLLGSSEGGVGWGARWRLSRFFFARPVSLLGHEIKMCVWSLGCSALRHMMSTASFEAGGRLGVQHKDKFWSIKRQRIYF